VRSSECDVFAYARKQGLLEHSLDLEHASCFISRSTITPTDAPGMKPWRKNLFIAVARNASSAIERFGLPGDRTVIMGSQVAPETSPWALPLDERPIRERSRTPFLVNSGDMRLDSGAAVSDRGIRARDAATVHSRTTTAFIGRSRRRGLRWSPTRSWAWAWRSNESMRRAAAMWRPPAAVL